MRIKSIVLSMLVVLVVMGSAMPLAADGGDEGDPRQFPVHMVLDPEMPQTFLESEEAKVAAPLMDAASKPAAEGADKERGLFPAHMVLDPDPPQTFLEADADKAPGPQTRPAPELAAAWQTVKFENFEGAFPNQWQLRGNPTWDDEWDSGSHFAYDLAHWTGWCAGGGSAARTPGNLPGGAYAPNMNAWMIYGPFSLLGYDDAAVDFWYWLWSEPLNDYVTWMASLDGSNFFGHGEWGNNKNWRFHTFDLKNVNVLGNVCGKPQVWVAFAFHSDSSLENKGVYLDDIHIKRKPTTPPTTGSVNPNSGGAACGTIRYFATDYYDANGNADLKACRFHVGRNAAPKSLKWNAVFNYHVPSNTLRIRNNNGTKWWGGKAVGSFNVVQNNQAKVYCNLTTVAKVGNLIRVVWAVEFKCSFRGGKKLYLKARDKWGATTPLQQKGTWTVY